MSLISTTLRALTLCLASATVVHAQENGEPRQPEAPLWIITCSNETNPEELLCEFSQSIFLTAQNGQIQRVGTLSFARAAGQSDTTAFLALPLEVSLAEQVRIAVDERDLAVLSWLSCDNARCYATADVDDAWMAAMRQGSELTAHFRTRDQQEVNFGFRLQDFTRSEAMLP